MRVSNLARTERAKTHDAPAYLHANNATVLLHVQADMLGYHDVIFVCSMARLD